ncbi:MAG TPA: DNA polymerase III subunit epsilon [Alphaproteobacteria bacterium]|nr:DNA polymerase III subunit epsilon [Alphaproteobacteria bacterium]
MREIVFDTETTGFSPQEGDRLVEIGAIETVDRIPTGKVYHVYINPERTIPEEAIRVHGITNEMIADKPTFAEVVSDMLEFFDDSPLVAHNAQFDMNFLNFQLGLENLAELSNPVVDTLKIAKKRFPGQRVSLDALCKKYEIDLSVRKYHGALLDAKLLGDVYLELTGGRQQSLAFDSGAKKGDADEFDNIEFKTVEIKPRPVIKATEEEIKNHQEFIAGIKGNIW